MSIAATFAAGRATKDNAPPDRGAEGAIPPGDEHDPHEDNTFGLPNGSPIRKTLKRWYRRIAREVLGTLPSIGVGDPDWPQLGDWHAPMARSMTPILSAYYQESGQRTLARLGLDPDEWRVVDPNTHRMIETQAFDFCASTLATTADDCRTAYANLRHELLTGIITEGEAVPKLTERVRRVFTGLNKSHASMIARTEASRAVNAASLESARQSGVVSRKKWLLSSNACPKCHAVADRVNAGGGIPLGEPFATGLSDKPAYADCPAAPLHPHCRCTLTYVLTQEHLDAIAAGEPVEPGPMGPDLETAPGRPQEPELPEHQMRQADVPAFLKGSAHPEIVYHATSEAAKEAIVETGVDVTKNRRGIYGKGFYTASQYVEQFGPAKIELAVKIKTPLRFAITEGDQIMKAFEPSADTPYEEYDARLTSNILSAGYDGIIIDRGKGLKWVVALTQDQIRVIVP